MSKWVEVCDAVEKEIQISGVAEEVRKSILELLAAEVTSDDCVTVSYRTGISG